MKGFIKCSNNHFYKESLPSCPYCPDARGTSKPPGGGATDPTQTARVNESGRTEYFGGNTSATESFSGDKTKVFTPGDAPSGNAGPGSGGGASAPHMPFDRTFIGGTPDTHISGEAGSAGGEKAPRAARRIVGWIVSYTLDPMGVDFRIYEGNNTIGRDPVNTIKISTDSTISGRHATILYRSGKFWMKDEMAANGCFLNGIEMEIQKAYEIHDKDELRLGNTVFKFKTCE